MIKRSDTRIILALAIPAVMQTLTKSSFSLIDSFWVGKLGSVQLASITVSNFLMWGIISMAEIISNGTNSLVAQSTGAGNEPLSKKISTLSIQTTLFYSFLVGILLIPVLKYLYDIIDLNPLNRNFSNDYLITFLIGLPCILLLSTVTSIFRGYGDTKTPFYLLIISASLNFLICPLLIFGVNGFLRFEIQGAAMSTLSAYLIAAIVGIFILKKRGLIDKIFIFHFDKKIVLETFRIGFPLALNGVAFSMIYVFVSRFVAKYGDTGLAALGIGHRSESIAYQTCVGFAMAATIMVGQYMGAGKPELASKFAWKIVRIGSVAIISYSVLLFVFSADVAGIFTSDPDVIYHASLYNKLGAVVMIFTMLETILTGAFSGAGYTSPPAITGLVFNFLRIPACALFSSIWGLEGIWFAICLSVVVKGVVLSLWFKKGSWKKMKFRLGQPDESIAKAMEIE